MGKPFSLRDDMKKLERFISFTPGPWKWHHNIIPQGGKSIVSIGGEIHQALTMSGIDLTICCHQNDQRLIATAPEMYKLLKQVFDSGVLYSGDYLEVKELLSKIEGK